MLDAVCPYYNHDEDVCDVGCGYISSHDASMIIRFCACQYQDCYKYRELATRFGRPDSMPPDSARRPLPVPAGSSETVPVLGLFCYGVTAASYSIDKLPGLELSLHLLAVILMLGAVGQISAGLNALRKTPLRAIAFTGSGLFWLSILALDILPRAGYGSVPGPLAMMGYFAMWGMFCLIICQALEPLTRTCRTVFAMMTAFLLALAMAHAIGGSGVLNAAVVLGIASSLPGIYLGLRHVSGEVRHLLPLEMARSGKLRS